MDMGNRIAELRSNAHMSQFQLAKVLGIGTSTLGMYETNKRKPSPKVLERIADYFNVSVDYLMTGKEKEGGETYYLNDETREIAQEIFENPDLKSLFDMSRKMTPERLKAHIEFIKKMQDSEN